MRKAILLSLIKKQDLLFFGLFPLVLSLLGWYWPNVALKTKVIYTIITLSLFVFIAMLRIINALLSRLEEVANTPTINQTENQPYPDILPSSISATLRVLRSFETATGMGLIVSPNPDLSLDMLVSLIYVDIKGTEHFFGLGNVQHIQADGFIQISLKNVQFDSVSSTEKLRKNDKKFVTKLKVSNIVLIRYLQGGVYK